MAKKDIIQELNDLGSSLTKQELQNPYAVPQGYFESFAENMLALVKANEESLDFLSSLPKETPYQIPANYFNEFSERMLFLIRNNSTQSVKEELEAISPLLSSLKKEPVYSVPEGYFENFQIPVEKKKQESKVVPMFARKWMRYAAAVVVTVTIALSVFVITGNKKPDPSKNPQAWVDKNLKKVSAEDIDAFVNLADEESIVKESIAAAPKPEEVKELIKDIPQNEIEQFLETVSYEDVPDETLLN